MLRRIARSFVRVVGVPLAAMAERLLRLSSRRAGLALVYHSVHHRRGDPATELVPPHGAELFAAQIEHLKARYRIVPAAELLEAVRRRRRGERFPVAITFDDDLSCHTNEALPILQRTGAHATFFLSGASLERPFSFWWERLQRAFDSGVPAVPSLVLSGGGEASSLQGIHSLGREIEKLAPADRDAVVARLAAEVGPDPADAGIRSAGVRALVAAGMTIGFHTLRHDRLPSLADDDLARAMRVGRGELEEVVRGTLAVIGYPHGAADERVAAAAREAGFQAGFTVDERAVEPNSDPLLLGRVSPSHRSRGAFAVQVVLHLLHDQR